MTNEDWTQLRAPIGTFDRIVVLDQIPSTQDEAKRLADRPGLAVIARRQIAGRGRQGRAWDDGGGASLSISMVTRASLPPVGLSLAAGLGVIEACATLGATRLGLKWPNDVVEHAGHARGRKLAGVLIETAGHLAVVGVGLNIAQQDHHWPPELRQAAVSLAQLGVQAQRPAVARAVLQALSHWAQASPDSIRDRWRDIGTMRDRHCIFRVDGRPISGLVVDLDTQWRLVLETSDRSRIRIDAANAHLEEYSPRRS